MQGKGIGSCEKKPLKFKLMALVVALLFSMGSHYATNTLNAVKGSFKKELGVNNASYGVVQSTVYLINTLMPLLGGVGMDRYGTAMGSIVSSSFILVGNVLVALGCMFDSGFYVILIGRVLHGFGSGMIVVAQETILGKWFSSSSIASVIGLQIGASRVSNFAAQFFSNMIVKGTGSVAGAMWVAASVCLASWLATVVYAIVLHRAGGEGITDKRTSFSPRRLLYLPVGVWIMPFTVMVLAGIWTPFLGSISDYIQVSYPSGDKESAGVLAGWKSSTSLLIPILLSPGMGGIIDVLGHRSVVVSTSAIFTSLSIGMLAFSTNLLYPALLLFSTSLTIGPVALTSSIPIMLPSELIGTGIGAHKSAMSVGITILHLLVGLVQDATPDRSYTRVMPMLFLVSLSALIFAIIYVYHSYAHLHRLLEVPASQRKAILDSYPDDFIKNKSAANLSTPTKGQKLVTWTLFALIAISWLFFIATLALNHQVSKKFVK